MAKEATLVNDLKELGFTPKESRAIVLRFQPKNLSDDLLNFFEANNYFILQLCAKELVFVPVRYSITDFQPKKEDLFKVAHDDIAKISLEEDKLNYILTINLVNGDELKFRVQQKELSDMRSSGVIGTEYQKFGLTSRNWHKENFDQTIEDLLALKK